MQPQGYVQANTQANPYQQPQVNVSVNTQNPTSYRGQTEETNGLATASMVCGIIGLLVFGIILGPLAIIFGAIGMSKEVKRNQAITGLVLGVIDIVGWFIFMAAFM